MQALLLLTVYTPNVGARPPLRFAPSRRKAGGPYKIKILCFAPAPARRTNAFSEMFLESI